MTPPRPSHSNELWNAIVSHIMLGLMMTCAAVTLMQLFERLLPENAMGFIAPAGLLISLEAIFSWHIVRQLPADGYERLLYRAAEAVTMLIVLRVYISLRWGVRVFFDAVLSWVEHFGEAFFSAEFLLAAFGLGLIWLVSSLLAQDLAEFEGDIETWAEAALPSDRRAIQRGLVGMVFAVGVGMVIVTALLRQESLPVLGAQPASRGSVIHIVAYFVLSLILLAQTNLGAWRAAWGYERAVISHDLTRCWTAYSVVFLVFISGLALLLPTHYAMGLWPTLRYLSALLFALIGFLLSLAALPFLFVFSWLGRLFSFEADQPPLPPPELPRLVTATPPITAPWWEVLKSALFWMLLCGVVIWAVVQYARQNRSLAIWLKQVLGSGWLIQLWNWFRFAWGWLRKNVGTAVQAGLRQLRAVIRPTVGEPWRYIALRRLNARQKVLFYYLALVRRGNEAGSPRLPWQTPLAYSRSLSAEHPEAATDIMAMTEAFLRARYTQHTVSPEQAKWVQRFWERVRQVLRHKGRGLPPA